MVLFIVSITLEEDTNQSINITLVRYENVDDGKFFQSSTRTNTLGAFFKLY